MSVESWNESELIEWLRGHVAPRLGPDEIGIGDDCAVLSAAGCGSRWLVSTDQLVEGVHFRLEFGTLRELGRRAAAVNLSDLAAMGGRPRHLLLSLAIPAGTDTDRIQELMRGVAERCERHGTALVGGDLSATSGPLTISITVLGLVGAGGPVLRSGARPGDRLLVSGTLGDAAAALAALKRGLERTGWWDPLLRRLVDPEPEVSLGIRLGERSWAHAAIDLSDGIAKDLRCICRESGVGAVIRSDRVPLSPELRRMAGLLGVEPLDWALSGGDDYRLLLAVPKKRVEDLASELGREGHRFTDIGRIVRQPGVWLQREHGPRRPMERNGYAHRG